MSWKDCFKNLFLCCLVYEAGKWFLVSILCLATMVTGKLPETSVNFLLPNDGWENLSSLPSASHKLSDKKDILRRLKKKWKYLGIAITTCIPGNHSIHSSVLSITTEEKQFLNCIRIRDISSIISSVCESLKNVVRSAMWEDWGFVHIKEQLVWSFLLVTKGWLTWNVKPDYSCCGWAKHPWKQTKTTHRRNLLAFANSIHLCITLPKSSMILRTYGKSFFPSHFSVEETTVFQN